MVNKDVIRSTWAGVDPQKAGIAFYANLEAKCPDVYAVFKLGGGARSNPKVAAQGMKVMTFVGDAVKGLDDMGAVGAKLDALAGRHTGYGAKKAHFPPAKDCFLDALEEANAACAGARGEWAGLYDVIADHLTKPLS